LNFFFEFCLFLCIIFALVSLFFYRKFRKSHFEYESSSSINVDLMRKENALLKDQLTQIQNSLEYERELINSQREEFNQKEKELIKSNSDLQNQLTEETEARRKVLSQKKSSEVRLGNIAETLAPFLEQFEFDPENCTFLGKPVDYISFGDDEITIIEIKSGNSQLNQKQRHIRDLVKNKLISWKEVRIK
jgi:predicted Holliday junction resolvase-like endonuclease